VIPLKRSFLGLLAILVFVAMSLVALPSVALAGVAEYQVQFAPADTPQSGIFIINVVLSPETKLPAKVRVPLPTGAAVLWSGEILGGDVANDPSREASVTAVAGGLVVEFTVEQVRVAQVEASWKAPTTVGGKVTSDVEWVNTTEAGTYTFAVRLPTGASDVKITPSVEGAPNTNAAGESLYVLAPVRLEEGASLPITVEYRIGGASGSGLFENMSPVLIGAIAALAIAIVALLVVVVRQGSVRSVSQSVRPAASSASRASSGTSRTGSDSDTTNAQPGVDTPDPEDDDEAFTWE